MAGREIKMLGQADNKSRGMKKKNREEEHRREQQTRGTKMDAGQPLGRLVVQIRAGNPWSYATLIWVLAIYPNEYRRKEYINCFPNHRRSIGPQATEVFI